LRHLQAMLDVATIEHLAKRLKEPAWVTDLRIAALHRHRALPWPHPSDEIWRRTDIKLLDPMQGFSSTPPSELFQSVHLDDARMSHVLAPIGDETLMVRANGSWIRQETPPGVRLADLTQVAQEAPALIKQLLEADSLTPPEHKLTSLNAAFHDEAVVLQVNPNVTLERPLRFVHMRSAHPHGAAFPFTVILVGSGSSLVLVDEYVSVPSSTPPLEEAPHLVNGRIELMLEPHASVSYVRIQRWDQQAREFLLQRAILREGAKLTTVNINFGSLVSKSHVITQLVGPQASSQLYGFVFGHGHQHVDQHSLQDHQAAHTTSDLLYKAALKDHSRMIYTGLIRIAKAAKQTDAYQANDNLLLSREAKAETIPMLEILADDVRCKHGATIGPVDEEQLFYLTTRGIPRGLAERLLVMGFVEPIISQVPFEPLRDHLREELEGSLHHQQGDG